MIGKLKTWLIKKLGGYSKAEYENLLKPSASIVTPIRHRELRKYRAYYNPGIAPSRPNEQIKPKDEELIKDNLLWELARGIKGKVHFSKIKSPYEYKDIYLAEITIVLEE